MHLIQLITVNLWTAGPCCLPTVITIILCCSWVFRCCFTICFQAVTFRFNLFRLYLNLFWTSGLLIKIAFGPGYIYCINPWPACSLLRLFAHKNWSLIKPKQFPDIYYEPWWLSSFKETSGEHIVCLMGLLAGGGMRALTPPGDVWASGPSDEKVCAGSCSVSAFSTHTAAVRLPCGALLFSTLLRCARRLLRGNERSVTFPASYPLTPYSETQSTCVKDHYAWGGGC